MVTQGVKDQIIKQLEIMEKNPKSALTEGFRRQANMFDDLDFIYMACSSGKDSTFNLMEAMLELSRRRWIAELLVSDPEQANELIRRFSEVRKAGLATQREDTVEGMLKWGTLDGTSGNFPDGSTTNLLPRIGMMQMDYELDYTESMQIMERIYKEYATDFFRILPKNPDGSLKPLDPKKNVKDNGLDLRWVDREDHKKNPYMMTAEEIERLDVDGLREVYGKAMIYGWGMYFPIAWENTAATNGDSRYLSYDPDKKKIWVNEPPIQFDPHHEWCMTLENMYDSFHGLRPFMDEIMPGMSDQLLRVEFSKYIGNVIPEALESGWPAKRYNPTTAQYE